MTAILLFLFVIICFGLILVILLQSSKGGGLAGAFGGGGGAGAVFGGRGAGNFLTKMTSWLAVGFLGIALLLSFLSRGGDESQSLIGQEQQKRGSVPAANLPFVPIGDSQQLLPSESPQPETAGQDSAK